MRLVARVPIPHATVVKCTYANGDSFEGNFSNDQRNGFGLYQYANGSKFEGEFRDDRKLQGTFNYPNGDKYVGEFEREEKNGHGIYYYGINISSTI
jgi:hypothetical protein